MVLTLCWKLEDLLMKTNYKDLVKQVYIDPIKNVLVIDDQYPTYKDLSRKGEIDYKSFSEESKAIALFDFLRESGFNCDIENNLDKIDDTPNHLTSSELLILDYHLNEQDGSDGTQAIKLLTALTKTPYFNSVILNTKGAEGDITSIAAEIYLNLKKREEVDYSDIVNIITDLEDDIIGFSENLISNIDYEMLVKVLCGTEISKKNFLSYIGKYQEIVNDNKELASLLQKNRELITNYLIFKKANDLTRNIGNIDNLKVNFESDKIWLEAENLFLVILKKNDNPSTLIDQLHDAIVSRKPNPVEIILTNIQNQIKKNGTSHSRTLFKDGIDAAWFLKAKSDNHSEGAISGLIKNIIVDFSNSIIEKGSQENSLILDFFELEDISGIMMEYFDKDISDVACENELYLLLNAYLCSTSHIQKHLTTGSILFKENEYWIVLNNSCDLVPGQNTSGWNNQVKPLRPFTAVKMKNKNKKELLRGVPQDKITNGESIIIKTDEGLKALSFREKGGNPHSELFYSFNNGEIIDGKIDYCHILYPKKSAKLIKGSFNIVGQLRYEYATRLLNMLSAHQSRVGVNFSPIPNKPNNI